MKPARSTREAMCTRSECCFTSCLRTGFRLTSSTSRCSRYGEWLWIPCRDHLARYALSFEGMAAHLRAHGMATQYFPEKLVIRDALPRTPSGKIQKFMLREEAKAFSAQR